jgi:hypothetical protein
MKSMVKSHENQSLGGQLKAQLKKFKITDLSTKGAQHWGCTEFY